MGIEQASKIAFITNALPSVNAGALITVCSGSQAYLNAGMLPFGTDSIYVWNNGGGNGPSPVIYPTANTTYTVTGTDIHGCIGTDRQTVTINPLPTLTASNNTPFCSGAANLNLTLNPAVRSKAGRSRLRLRVRLRKSPHFFRSSK